MSEKERSLRESITKSDQMNIEDAIGLIGGVGFFQKFISLCCILIFVIGS